MKQCRECGTISPDDTGFCYICGRKFPDLTEAKTQGGIDTIDDERYETTCPICGIVFCCSQSTLDSGKVICPNCGEFLEITTKDSEDCENGVFLMFDGLYQCDCQNYSSFLRFFSNGLVVQVSSTGSPKQVYKWLTQNFESRGTYTVSGGQISFDIVSTNGRLSYSGTIINSTILQLDSHSYINGYKASNLQYHFCKCI